MTNTTSTLCSVPQAPRLSVVVVVHDMAVQARNTLRSLLPAYQRDVGPTDYEVIVVENRSLNLLDAEFIASLPSNFRYVLREEALKTPVHAINEGAGLARGDNICIMIDGARLVTPGIVRGLLAGHRVHDHAVVAAPGYHVGSELQQVAAARGYDVEQDQQLLASVDWYQNGYALFDIACFSGSCAAGLFRPMAESNCLSMPRQAWDELGGMDTGFDLPGGGMVNLDLYKRACELPGVKLIMLPGEGTFHQFHRGVTTGGVMLEERDRLIEAIKTQYRELRGHEFRSPSTTPIYLGELSANAHRFVQLSSSKVLAAAKCRSDHSQPVAHRSQQRSLGAQE